MLIIESAFDHEDLFTPPVLVITELGVRSPFHQCHLFGAILMQRQNLQTVDQTCNPPIFNRRFG